MKMARLVPGRSDQAALEGKGTNARKDIAAVVRIGHDRLVDKNLQEQVIDIDPLALRLGNHCNLAG
jgi:hypothetical protein